MLLVKFLFFTSLCCLCVRADTRVLYALNAGGVSHVGSNGINYLADTTSVGVSSDYGARQHVKRAPLQDQLLYQTERWHDSTFHYTIPVHEEGSFVLVLKFAEVYFHAPQQKVFDVRINGQHVVARDLDIFAEVGNSVAHDVLVPFTIDQGKLKVEGEMSTIGNQLKLELVKGSEDNPKICAFYLLKGTVEDVDKLPPLVKEDPNKKSSNQNEENSPIDTFDIESDEEEYDPEEEDLHKQTQGYKKVKEEKPQKKKVAGSRKVEDPYKDDHTSLFLPILISLSVFIPTLLLLCRV